MGKISKKDVEDALSKAVHPEISYSLLKLGMIKDIRAGKGRVSLTLALPFLGVPIKEDLIGIVRDAVRKLDRDAEIEVRTAEMDNKEKARFMKLAKEGWKV
jgi:metal-sulfur cluster biosynthetic enzyme